MDPVKNSEGYTDTVPYEVDKNMAKEYEAVRKLVRTIHYICELAGFSIQGRIVLVNKKNGKIWR